MSDGEQRLESGTAPERSAVERAFRNHHAHFADLSGEVALQQLEDERSIRRQYAGRVVYELLQNALDRAESEICVRLVETMSAEAAGEYALLVANDGPAIRVDPEYDYERPPEVRERKRPDFNALCSLHTSNKSPDESVGNKGIGFRSVFSISDHVRVWSRLANTPGWWGLEMHLPLDGDRWQQRLTRPSVERGHDAFLQSGSVPISSAEHPSFHFPLPLRSNDRPDILRHRSDLTTAVVVPVSSDRYEQVRESLEELRTNHLYFVGLFEDRRDLTVRVDAPTVSFTRSTWPESDDSPSRAISRWASPRLEAEAAQADHNVSEPGAAVAWPVDDRDDEQLSAGIYGYLPTRVDAPFGIDIHGDFQLRIDRTGLRLDDEIVGPYNRTLLEIAAELHLLRILREMALPHETLEWVHVDPSAVRSTDVSDSVDPRADLWQLLDPAGGTEEAATVVVDHVSKLLFPDAGRTDAETYELWAQLAARYFDRASNPSLETYRDFWTASKAWIDHRCPYSDQSKTWRQMVTALCDAVRLKGVPVVPVETTVSDGTSQLRAVPLPERSRETAGRRRRHSRTVFVRRGDEESLPLPEALRRADRAVTSFQFPPTIVNRSPQPLGTRPFNRWEVLSELRQIPNSQANWSPDPIADDPETAAELQRGLIEYAAELYLYDTQGGRANPAQSDAFGLGWRVLDDAAIGETARQTGRSLATLFLPTVDGAWEPARQLTKREVDDVRLGDLPSELDLDAFLVFLGVAPSAEDGPPLTLIEGGPDGRVEPRASPPQLADAGRGGVANVSLGLLPNEPEDMFPPVEWRDSLRVAWDDWLAELVTLEHESRDTDERSATTSLVEPLSTRAWYPVDVDESLASAPGILSTERRAAAPRQLTLLSHRQQGFPAILWSVDERSPDTELLTALGAISGIDRDDLDRDDAAPAFRLLDQLRELDLGRIEERPTARQALVNLYTRLLEAIVAGDHEQQELDRLSLLCYQPEPQPVALADRELTWVAHDRDDVWIVADSRSSQTTGVVISGPNHLKRA
ncbi:ATP-binding protein [Natrinema sp. JCM 9743]